MTPDGNPASVKKEQKRMAVRGVNSEGLRTAVLPIESAKIEY